MSISLDEIVVSGLYSVNYFYNNTYKEYNLNLDEIENNLYKFSKITTDVSEVEILVLSSDDYGSKWTCNFI